ncbi:MAG: DeoR/GlpR family DNA-binding transcription regulator [Hespellia sp.]|nr:DeoR/GlpR family DNA-binding transcription regulator [Hespellia sp.]
MYSIERRTEIERILYENGSVSVSVLAQELSSSKETIRRDLCELESLGILKRTHGGAIPLTERNNTTPVASETPVTVRTIQNVTEKQRICRAAAKHIQDGDTIFIDNSTTCIGLYQYIPDDIQITFLTNSIAFLLECSKKPNPRHTFICLGGIFKHSNLSIYGNTTIKNASQYYPNKAFISCCGISPDQQITDSGIQEIDVKRALCKSSQKVYLLADYTKIENTGQVYLCDYNEIDTLITDDFSELSKLQYLIRSGIEIEVAK